MALVRPAERGLALNASARFAGRLLLGLVLAALTGCGSPAAYDQYAVVYGISLYDPGLAEGEEPNLVYADDDAEELAETLLAQGYQVRLRTDTAADRDSLMADIAEVAGEAGEEDLFLFYFSGHGGQRGSGDADQAADSADEYIFLYGSLLDPGLTFSDDQLPEALAGIRARKKVVIIDACNSGGFIGNELEADGEPASQAEGGAGFGGLAFQAIRLYANFDGSSGDIPPWEALVLSASGERENSLEGPPYNHGIFTYYLLEADTLGDRNGDGWVTVTEAFAHAQEGIRRDAQVSGEYSPHVSGGPVDYVLFEVR